MERVLDEISFNAPELTEKDVRIDGDYVRKMLADSSKIRTYRVTFCRNTRWRRGRIIRPFSNYLRVLRPRQ